MTKRDEIAITKFKATCLAVLEQVRKTGQPVRVTRFGKPVADIVPPAPAENDGSWLGRMAGTISKEDLDDLLTELDKHPLLSPGMEERWLASWEEQERKGEEIAKRNRKRVKPDAS